MRGETVPMFQGQAGYFCFNPLSPYGERPSSASIFGEIPQFQPTLPVRGETNGQVYRIVSGSKFQSTLPVRGETPVRRHTASGTGGFNPLSPCGERRSIWRNPPLLHGFNPLSPCGERHLAKLQSDTSKSSFQSTLPVWGETLLFAISNSS